MKKTKLALFHSLIALLLCVSMFVGTTFAWFTDEVTSMNNIIQSGRLDVELEYRDANGDWQSVDQNTNVFDPNALWEPGHTEVVYLRVSNKGNLALKYELGINVASQTLGTNVYGNSFKLSDYIEMGAVAGKADTYATRQEARNAVTTSGTLSSGYVTYGSIEANAAEQYIALVVFMPEDVDNVANYKTGTTPPTINLGITLLATQMTAENDSFGNNYDEGAKHPLGNINFSSTQSVADLMENGALTQDVTVGNPNGDIYAEVPSDVKLADGATSLELTVQTMQNSEADIKLENGETATSLDVHMDGVHEDNTVPMLITLKGLMKTGLNSTSVALYHVEDGVTVPMTMVTNPVNHNEFSYDPATGDVVMALASFSEIDVVTNNWNPWKGEFDTSWYNTTDTEFTLTTADQLAGFGAIVDGGYTKQDGTKAEITADTFAGKTIKLGSDINLAGGVSLNPIGCGYVNGTANSGDKVGHSFMGTFDGQGHTISNLYQNGWDIGLSYCNLGGGLFASVCDATIKDLTISGANIVMECVEQGILVGLSQGTCTYENINIYNSKVANYQKATGGLIGEISVGPNGGGTTIITDVVIGPDVVVGSLWGDFDAPVGGVIGARWDDSDTTKVVMENVTVACRLDVYNDVTSTYQWYAYRRAGMLIGNTEKTDPNNSHLAYADFLTCKKDENDNNTVFVYYGDWVNYHYCEFSDYNPNWPFVRVEEGENCSAFSNPRWGVPELDGVKVTPENHPITEQTTHKNGDDCMVLLAFNQLYGGGQGVYGQPEHTGVTVESFDYTVTYINDGQVVKTDYVENGSVYYPKEVVPTVDNKTVEYWENAYSQEIPSISADNTTDYTLYPKIEGEYAVRFLSADETVIGWGKFNASGMISMYYGTTKVDTLTIAPAPPDIGEDFEGYWATKDGTTWDTWKDNIGTPTSDVLFYAYYNSSTLNLTPIYENGIQVAYAVAGPVNYETVDLVIPDYVNGYPITTISANAFAGFSKLEDIYIPHTVTEIGANAFCANNDTSWSHLGEYPMIQIIYDGTKAEWNEMVTRIKNEEKIDWDDNIGRGSQIVCLRETETGYYQQNGLNTLNYTSWEWQSGSYPTWFTEGYPDLVPSN